MGIEKVEEVKKLLAGELHDTSEIGELHPEVKEYIKWLIQQAERVEELELEINDWRAEVQKWQQFYKESEESHLEALERVEELKKQLEQVKKAADFLLFQIGLARSKSLIKAEFSGEEKLYKALKEEIHFT